jgi:hypothetical protein
MKKRTKLSLRTTIYLTIVALLALTGVFYAANPDKFATASKSVAAPDAPMAHPTPFAMLEGPNGVAALPDVVLATQQLSQNLSAIDCQGNVTTVATIPGAVGSPVEKYLAVAPAQSTAAGFTPRDVFITQGTDIFKFSGGIVTPFATLGCPVSTHSSLTFDHVGTFGNKMIATCENGPVWTVAENPITHLGDVTLIAIVNSGGSTEGPAIAPTPGPGGVPPGFGPLGGQILVADDENGQVHAIDYHAGHAVTLNVFNWVSPDWLGAESINVIPNTPCANCSEGAYFQAIFDGGLHPNTIIKFPLTDFIGLGGSILVNSESIPGHGTALVSFNPVTNAYETTVFDNEVGRQEGASFVDCDVPTPTPSPTPTPEIPTPTPSPTPTATPSGFCPLTIGYWKNHSNAWPVNSLMLGSKTYTKAELLSILNNTGGGDASMILAVQLIAAKLNIAAGSDPAPIASTITHADGLLSPFSGKLPYHVAPSSNIGQMMVSDGSTLDNYNNGRLTPRCRSGQPAQPARPGRPDRPGR